MYGADRPAVVERRLGADARGDEAAAADPHDVLAQVAAEQARRVAEAVRMRARLRVEQDARAVERARAEHDHLRLEVHHLARVRVDDAHAGGAVRRLVEEHLRDHRVRPDGEVAGVARGIDERRRRVEGRA